jgi:hypothetical protein
MRYNPPPNWPPAPPGWTPPPGWQPDPSWGPVPPGWSLWTDDTGHVQDAPVEYPAYADAPPPYPAPPPPKKKTGLILAFAAVVVVLAVMGGVIAVVATRDSSGTVASSTSSTSSASSDEDALRAVIDEFEQTWNDKDYDGWSALLCKKMEADSDFDEQAFDEIREMGGTLRLSVNSLEIDGDDATVNISQRGEDPDDIAFVREGGEWKWCEL